MTDGHNGQTSIFLHTHTHWLDLMEKLKGIIVQSQIKILFTPAETQTLINKDRSIHTHARAHMHAHTHFVSKMHLLLFSFLFTRDAEGTRTFILSSSFCLHVWVVCLSPGVCSFVSVCLVLCLCEYDEKRWQRLKMMLEKTKTERDNERLNGGKEVVKASFSLTVSELRIRNHSVLCKFFSLGIEEGCCSRSIIAAHQHAQISFNYLQLTFGPRTWHESRICGRGCLSMLHNVISHIWKKCEFQSQIRITT